VISYLQHKGKEANMGEAKRTHVISTDEAARSKARRQAKADEMAKARGFHKPAYPSH
jgi:hypothetical protein